MSTEPCTKHPHAVDPLDCADCWWEERIEEFAAGCHQAILTRLRILMIDGNVESAASDLARYAGERMQGVAG